MSLALSSFGPSSVLLSTRRGTINCGRWHITAMGAQSRDNLDHMQRASKPQQSQPLLKRRAAPSSPIGLWDRFPTARTIQQMMDTMERVMEDPLAYGGASLPSLSGEDSVGSYRRRRTPWEIKEGAGEYRMRFDMPGMTKKDVKVWVEERMLVIEAEKLPAKEGEAEEWSATSYGRYSSRIALPDNVLVEQIKAEVKDGVLYITIPKASTSTKVLDIDVR
ncbi:small heat shock protein, chloroplastic [Musa acuminata AAA Group]|uniref:small heat shock protein, chloroplastic n=1 Tax=Musa acuminata AAA Group TaxID=214697 RepID=UPI0031D38498